MYVLSLSLCSLFRLTRNGHLVLWFHENGSQKSDFEHKQLLRLKMRAETGENSLEVLELPRQEKDLGLPILVMDFLSVYPSLLGQCVLLFTSKFLLFVGQGLRPLFSGKMSPVLVLVFDCFSDELREVWEGRDSLFDWQIKLSNFLFQEIELMGFLFLFLSLFLSCLENCFVNVLSSFDQLVVRKTKLLVLFFHFSLFLSPVGLKLSKGLRGLGWVCKKTHLLYSWSWARIASTVAMKEKSTENPVKWFIKREITRLL